LPKSRKSPAGGRSSRRARLARIVERALDVQIVPVGQVALAFEWEHLRRFFEHFRVDCVFDVGANVGQYATMLRQRVGYDGPIISYEPDPDVAAQLRSVAASERSWTVEELALDAVAGHAAFNVLASSEFSSLHPLSDLARQQFSRQVELVRSVEVRTATLADELAKYQKKLGFERPYLKLDTQGHDLTVATGAGDRLRDFVGLQSELAIRQLYEGAPKFDEALQFYRERGFELSALVPNNLGHFPRLLEIDCIMFRV
jgi:FkbM family methyltransferase